MISNELDIAPYRRILAERDRVQIADFLQPAAAEALQRCLASEIPWNLAERSDGMARTSARGEYPQDDAFADILQRAYARARDEYQFAYDTYMLIRASREGWDPQLLVHSVLGFFNTPEFIAFTRLLTGAHGSPPPMPMHALPSGPVPMPHEDEE